jgi:hypothetical protein
MRLGRGHLSVRPELIYTSIGNRYAAQRRAELYELSIGHRYAVYTLRCESLTLPPIVTQC